MIRSREELKALMHAKRIEGGQLPPTYDDGTFAWYYMGCMELMNPEEVAAVRALWDEMPGHTCLDDAFRQWMEGDDALGDFVPVVGSKQHWVVYYRKVRDDWDKNWIYGFPEWAFTLAYSSFNVKVRLSEAIRELTHYRNLNEGLYYWRNL